MGPESSEGREDIRTAVAKSKQRHASQTLAHAQHARDGVQVDAEEVAGGDANGAEQQGEPEGHHGEGDWLGVGQAAVVERQVGDDAGLLVGAVCEDEGALVSGMVDETALRRRLAIAEQSMVGGSCLLVEYRDLPLAHDVTGGRLTALVLCPREHGDQGNGEESKRKGPRRVLCAAPSLHCVQERALVHGHDMLLHARGWPEREGALVRLSRTRGLVRWRHNAEGEGCGVAEVRSVQRAR